MFSMSRMELLARFMGVESADFGTLKPEKPINIKIVLYMPFGMVVCTSAKRPTYEEITAQLERSVLNPLDWALAQELPAIDALDEEEKELFILCKDAKIIPFSGPERYVEELCIPVSSVLGFAVGSQN